MSGVPSMIEPHRGKQHVKQQSRVQKRQERDNHFHLVTTNCLFGERDASLDVSNHSIFFFSIFCTKYFIILGVVGIDMNSLRFVNCRKESPFALSLIQSIDRQMHESGQLI